MAKSAQQKFNEYLAECQETRDAVNEMTAASYDRYEGHSYAAGYLGSMVVELIGMLPKAKRAEFREQLFRQAQTDKNFTLAKMIKETA